MSLRQLGAVVGHDRPWPTAQATDTIQFASHARARERCVGDECQALARVVVNDSEHPEEATVRDRAGEKIEAPARIGPIRHAHGPARAQRPFAAAAPAHLQLLLAIEPPQLLLVHHDALAIQHDVDPAVAEPPPRPSSPRAIAHRPAGCSCSAPSSGRSSRPRLSHAPGISTRNSFTEFKNTMTSGPRWMNAAWIGPIQPMSAAVMPSTCTTPTPTHRFS